MRFVLAVVALVVAALLVGLGLAQRTIFAPPDSVTSTVTTKGSAPITVVPSSALQGYEGKQTIRVSGGSTAFAAYGRSTDIKGWVGDASYNSVTFDKTTHELVTKTVAGSKKVPDPKDSDLWYQQYSGSSLTFSLAAPAGISLIILSDGSSPAPSTVSVTWPLSTATPLVGPLVSGGLLMFVIGVLLLVWAIAHHRRTRGPRRIGGGKPPKLPRGERRRAVRQAALGAHAPRGARRGIRRSVAIVPVVLVSTLALAGCSSQYWPSVASGGGSTATPSASATAAGPKAENLQPPAATVSQVERIVKRITAVQTTADTNLDATLAATRFTGPALAQRTANYAIRKADSTAAAPLAIPAGKITLTLPQQADSWPRSIFAVVQDSSSTTVAPVGVMLVQSAARDPYKVDYLVALEAQAKVPLVAPASIGAAQLSPDVKLLSIAPDELAAAYGDILANGDASKYAADFDADGDTLRAKIGKPYKDAKSAALPTTASIAYSSKTDPTDSIAFATNKAGAIVAVDLDEVETVKPTTAGAEVSPEGEVKSLSGITTTTKGVEATYGVQLLFSVPPVGSKDKIVLLGFSQALVSAKETP